RHQRAALDRRDEAVATTGNVGERLAQLCNMDPQADFLSSKNQPLSRTSARPLVRHVGVKERQK
ncbi:hypothetical protein, partial [Bradyrhizobium brasilense]|uniref:hypothetical protein n=1 Tax=Bradyrhizobium brasilense TaxID=1419277 RepID=UPI001E35C9AF